MILDDLIDKCETIDDFIIENNVYDCYEEIKYKEVLKYRVENEGGRIVMKIWIKNVI